ncbi:MAG: nucleotidyltransferase substrate binding protein [Hydrogenothermaceae bacterium]
MKQDIRWIQRFKNFEKALKQLSNGISLYNERELTEIEKQGLIQTFEYSFELAWNLIRDYLIYQGIADIRGSRDSFKLGFKYSLIDNPDIWFEMIVSRDLTTHTYNEDLAEEILQKIAKEYFPEFVNLKQTFEKLIENE